MEGDWKDGVEDILMDDCDGKLCRDKYRRVWN